MWDMSVSSTTYNSLSVILPFENTTKAQTIQLERTTLGTTMCSCHNYIQYGMSCPDI